ncbi:ribosome biogenesis GTPase RsgA, partial [Oleiphilus sp. HI0067]
MIWRPGADNSGVIEARLERSTLLQRPDNYGQLKPVASNIDRILIVVALEPTPFANLIDRYLVAAETTGIEPAILFNKSDLITDDNRDFIHGLMDTYKALGYEVLLTSANDEQDCSETLLSWLSNHTSVFVGQSGVGKSSLIRTILGDQSIRVGELSENTRKGTHTTTTAKLFHLPQGGRLVDSPGIREFGLWHITEAELLEGFTEFRPFIGYCKFRDCKHEQEPGCAIQQALEEGKISETRMQSYRHILSTLDDI